MRWLSGPALVRAVGAFFQGFPLIGLGGFGDADASGFELCGESDAEKQCDAREVGPQQQGHDAGEWAVGFAEVVAGGHVGGEEQADQPPQRGGEARAEHSQDRPGWWRRGAKWNRTDTVTTVRPRLTGHRTMFHVDAASASQ